jgi:hypothetical protein
MLYFQLDPRNPSDSFSLAFGWAGAVAEPNLLNTEIFPTSEVCLKEETRNLQTDIFFEATRMYDRRETRNLQLFIFEATRMYDRSLTMSTKKSPYVKTGLSKRFTLWIGGSTQSQVSKPMLVTDGSAQRPPSSSSQLQ